MPESLTLESIVHNQTWTAIDAIFWDSMHGPINKLVRPGVADIISKDVYRPIMDALYLSARNSVREAARDII